MALFCYANDPLTLTAKSLPLASIGNQQQDGSSRGRPSKRRATGSRVKCPIVKLPLMEVYVINFGGKYYYYGGVEFTEKGVKCQFVDCNFEFEFQLKVGVNLPF
jgi:hypothetical protein